MAAATSKGKREGRLSGFMREDGGGGGARGGREAAEGGEIHDGQ